MSPDEVGVWRTTLADATQLNLIRVTCIATQYQTLLDSVPILMISGQRKCPLWIGYRMSEFDPELECPDQWGGIGREQRGAELTTLLSH